MTFLPRFCLLNMQRHTCWHEIRAHTSLCVSFFLCIYIAALTQAVVALVSRYDSTTHRLTSLALLPSMQCWTCRTTSLGADHSLG